MVTLSMWLNQFLVVIAWVRSMSNEPQTKNKLGSVISEQEFRTFAKKHILEIVKEALDREILELVRRWTILEEKQISSSTLDREINDGLFTPGISVGARAKAWPRYEVEVIKKAEIAGFDRDKKKLIVCQLMRKRSVLRQKLETEFLTKGHA